jgi:hypothetical protein
MKSKRDEMNANYAKVEKRLGATTGASKGNHAATKWKVRPSGTNPLKKRVGIKATKKF